jgi:PhnB protein
MSDVKLSPYLFFSGNAKEAMDFYKGVFGGELTTSTYGEFKGSMPEGVGMDDDKLMHANLVGEVNIMAGDSRNASAEAKKIELSLSGTDDAKLKGYFEALADGGKITMPLEKAPWGDTFGMLTDKYSVAWMVNISTAKS